MYLNLADSSRSAAKDKTIHLYSLENTTAMKHFNGKPVPEIAFNKNVRLYRQKNVPQWVEIKIFVDRLD